MSNLSALSSSINGDVKVIIFNQKINFLILCIAILIELSSISTGILHLNFGSVYILLVNIYFIILKSYLDISSPNFLSINSFIYSYRLYSHYDILSSTSSLVEVCSTTPFPLLNPIQHHTHHSRF